MRENRLTDMEKLRIFEDPNITRIQVDPEGLVSVVTYESRGDGGPIPWLKYIGHVTELRQEWGGRKRLNPRTKAEPITLCAPWKPERNER